MSRSKPKRRRDELFWPERFDVAVVEFLEPVLGSAASRAVGAIGNAADQPPLLLLSAAMLVAGRQTGDRRLRRAGERMLLAHLLATAAKTWGKNNVDRSRPDELMEKGRYRMRRGRSRDKALQSFPSGHTAGAVAVARAFAREYPEWATPAYLAAGLLGALQLPRLAHFPTDIFAGAAVGIAAEAAVHGMMEWAE
jgi:membrane-associated phospholipid phosphatase